MKFLQLMREQKESWMKGMEHGVMRLVSLIFSIVSAHAIRWIFSPLDTIVGADKLQPFITWAAAIAFGITGYFVSRGLAYRLMRGESFWSYIPLCLVVELVEIFANYAQAAGVIQYADWLHSAPANQQGILIVATYVVLSIVPLVSIFLAVVDMDLERSKEKVSRAPAAVPNGARLQPAGVTAPGVSRANGGLPALPPKPPSQAHSAVPPRQYGAPALASGTALANPTPGVRTQAAPAQATSVAP